MKFAPALCFLLAFIVGVVMIRIGSQIFGSVMLTLIVVAAAFVAWNNRAKIRVWWQRKQTEWASDAKQLGLWLKLATTRNRDAHATATMAHQQQFLQGRIADPVNLIGIAAVAVLLLPLVGGFQEWRINRVKAERDAPCSEHEITRNRDGHFQTGREACASLGATAEAATEWRERAITAEAAHVRDVATARLEGERALQLERNRRQRASATTIRQGRRDNEALTSAIGGGAPDLERSLCELTGREPCDATGSSPGTSAPTGPASVPTNAGDADATGAADTSR